MGAFPRRAEQGVVQPMPEIQTPDWVKHAVFYQIFPDRFAKSERMAKPGNLEPWDSDPTAFGYKGGDLIGVMERLDYLEDLGATALSFNPIFQSASNHRYHTHDYERVDPLLGGDAALDALIAACRRRGLRVVLDGVFNHASRGFFRFNDVLENGAASPWLDWFTFHQHPANAYDHNKPPGYAAWVGLHALPKLNTDNPEVREYLMGIAEHWLRKGIDGWRLDVAAEIVTPGFWAEFRRRVKAINPEAYIVAEIWEEAQPWLQGDQFDAVMNYRFTEAAISFAAGRRVIAETVAGRGYAPYPGIDAATYAAKIDRLLGLYPWQIQLAQLNLLDGHDTSRFVTIAGGDADSVRLGTFLMFTFPGAPCVYYGDEIGLTGALPDHWARKSFPWDHPDRWDRDALDFHKRIISLRHDQPALRTGTYHRLFTNAGLYVFGRANGDTTLIGAVNAGDEVQSARIPLAGLPSEVGAVAELFRTGDGQIAAQVDAGTLALTVPARRAVLWSATAGANP